MRPPRPAAGAMHPVGSIPRTWGGPVSATAMRRCQGDALELRPACSARGDLRVFSGCVPYCRTTSIFLPPAVQVGLPRYGIVRPRSPNAGPKPTDRPVRHTAGRPWAPVHPMTVDGDPKTGTAHARQRLPACQRAPEVKGGKAMRGDAKRARRPKIWAAATPGRANLLPSRL